MLTYLIQQSTAEKVVLSSHGALRKHLLQAGQEATLVQKLV